MVRLAGFCQWKWNKHCYWHIQHIQLKHCKKCLTVLVTTTPEPTPRPRIEYQIATWSLVGACIITLIIIASLGITLWLRTRASWQPARLAASHSLLHGDIWCHQPCCFKHVQMDLKSGLSKCLCSTTISHSDETEWKRASLQPSDGWLSHGWLSHSHTQQ